MGNTIWSALLFKIVKQILHKYRNIEFMRAYPSLYKNLTVSGITIITYQQKLYTLYRDVGLI